MMAEYIALSTSMRTVIPLRTTLQEIFSTISHSTAEAAVFKTTIHEDNNPALILANAELPRLTPGSKNFAVKYHWFRQHLKPGELEVQRIDTSEQLADILTKPLPRESFERMRLKLIGW
jgi:hypothetical protein